MRLTVLGACGAWPEAGRACSGFLVEAGDFRLLLDVGYATLPRLLELMPAERLDAVLISHGHPDHCADLNPLLRARAMQKDQPVRLPVYAPTGSLAAVLALDRPGMLDAAYALHEFDPGAQFSVGPFDVVSRALPHFVPNAGLRLSARGRVLAYTGDAGPCPEVVELARDADLFICEATYVDAVPPDSNGKLASARAAGLQAGEARVARLILTHLWPGTDPGASRRAAAMAYDGWIEVARGGLVVDLL